MNFANRQGAFLSVLKVMSNQNQNSYFISDIGELKSDWFLGIDSVGICGATSTPRWLMESVQKAIEEIA